MRDQLLDVRVIGKESAGEGGIVVARLEGEIDSSNAADLEAALGRRIPNLVTGLILDLSAVSYLDSAGIQFLFDLASRLGRRRQQLVIVLGEGSQIRRTLEISQLASVVMVEDSVAAAEAAIAEKIAPHPGQEPGAPAPEGV